MNVYQTRHHVCYFWMKFLLLVTLTLTLFSLFHASAQAQSCTPYPSPQTRFGYNVARDGGRRIDHYDVTPLKAHWYLDYFTQSTPTKPTGMAYAQMIRPPLWQQATFTATVESVLENNPGTLWIVGNEPDRDKQDGLTPTAYATFYHDVYTFLKTRDPAAQVAIAGVVQSTPLRRRYLDMVLAEYEARYDQKMPIDVWTMHAFILPEDYVWGASIPPGLEAFAGEGMKYTIFDHNNLEIFKANVVAFRQWMSDRGYRATPLLVTEYGILLSPDHGFPYEKVRTFMVGSFDFFLSATDANTGYVADGNRLVQAWSWFSLNYPPYNEATGAGHNGNLLEPDTGALLPLGQDFGAYIATLTAQNKVALTLPTAQLTPSILVITPTVTATLTSAIRVEAQAEPALTTFGPPSTAFTLTTTLANAGNVAACNLTIKLWQRDPKGNLTLLTTQTMASLAAANQQNSTQVLTFTWLLDKPIYGLYEIIVEAEADNANSGLPVAHVRQTHTFLVLPAPFSLFTYLALIQSK